MADKPVNLITITKDIERLPFKDSEKHILILNLRKLDFQALNDLTNNYLTNILTLISDITRYETNTDINVDDDL